MSNDEIQLIQLAQQGDAEACAALYDHHYDAVYRYCYYRVQNVPLAEDLTSEVFVRMVEKLDTFRDRGRPLLAWLYTIARNLIADRHRRGNPGAELPLDEAVEFGSDASGAMVRGIDRRLEADCLAAALQHLTEDQRRVILLRFMEDLTHDRVARILGKSEGATKALQHRALKALRRAIEKERCYEV